jgi:hypothetical protein
LHASKTVSDRSIKSKEQKKKGSKNPDPAKRDKPKRPKKTADDDDFGEGETEDT